MVNRLPANFALWLRLFSGVCLFTATAASPSPAPTAAAVVLPTVAPADAALMTAAIDDQLATDGYGKLCIDGPDSFPAIVYSDDEDATLQTQVKELLEIGFIRVASARTIADHVTATRYDLTAAGEQNYTTYRRLGFGGDYHGWCFADYRVGRIVSSESGPFCSRPGRLLSGFAAPDLRGACSTIVTYLPQLVGSAKWIRLAQARLFPPVAGLGTFLLTPLAATLTPLGDSWQMTTSALGVQQP
jgi:hypothetical protein